MARKLRVLLVFCVGLLFIYFFLFLFLENTHAITIGTIVVTPPKVEVGKPIAVSGSKLDKNRTLDLVVTGGSCSGFVCGKRNVVITDANGDFPQITYSTWPGDPPGTKYKVKMMTGGVDVSNEVEVELIAPSGSSATPGQLAPGADCTFPPSGYTCPSTAPCLPDNTSTTGRMVCGGVNVTPAAPTAQPLPPPCSEWRDQAGNIIPPQTAASRNDKYCAKVKTGLGIDISTHPFEFVRSVYGILLSISGGIALLLIIYSGYKIMTSGGNPETIQGARETLTSAIVGLLFLIFSMILLQIIGVDILHIPGLQ